MFYIMKHFILALSLAFLPLAAEAGNFDKYLEKPYSELRSEMVSKGWAPSPQTPETDCFYRMEVRECIQFPEIRARAGS